MSIKIVVGIIGMFVLGGVSMFLVAGKSDSNAVTLSENQGDAMELLGNVKAPRDFKGTGSFSALMGKKGSMKCTFVSEEGGVHSEGTFYFDHSNERFRVDVESIIDGGPFVSNVVNDGTHIYSWGTAMDVGMKMDAKMADISEESFGQYKGEHLDESSVDMEEDVAYDCVGWKVEERTFVPDASVEFMDTQELMKQMMGGMPEGFDIDAYSNLQVN